ncbi:hypothetical protein XX58_000073 [Salmonella enterica subsp. salamae]|uniref:Uncharacterized protein n=8 Tax=Salmonella enterica subsp. salamae TaxID=59202 RepID=A0A737SA04_SALER|nr:hypothetical protein [Salmonella enterica]EDQ3821040.1 hypothetical protein [Salmonella enterica subsp. salamae]EDQ6106660.1 hypothetical protein [Salmonella enterica subsp. enterica]EDS8307742.1 hypothetical protein [Salmonella enterica subsp. enterica serovar Java]EDT7497185.1 hypothetical protein [Salmonella enterica subsp. enterica serovar Schleissheim]EDU6438300.1 hypothetical protein [Salmonella enterica subsp. salamae serovar 47:b:e,n,x,z15]EDX4958279.1 hypothetical protein [Salmone
MQEATTQILLYRLLLPVIASPPRFRIVIGVIGAHLITEHDIYDIIRIYQGLKMN